MDVPLRSKSLEVVILNLKKRTATPAVARPDNLTAVARRQYVPTVRMDGGCYAMNTDKTRRWGAEPPHIHNMSQWWLCHRFPATER